MSNTVTVDLSFERQEVRRERLTGPRGTVREEVPPGAVVSVLEVIAARAGGSVRDESINHIEEQAGNHFPSRL